MALDKSRFNLCNLSGCASVTVTVTKPLTVTVKSQTGTPYPDLKVYAFDGTRYTGFNGTTDANGQVTLTLPQGSYHFRADYDGVQFWSSVENTCTLPGCESAAVLLPGKKGEETVTINYTYDPLYRLTAADYSTGDFYHYAYDSVGNRLTQESTVNGLSSMVNYQYDNANRLTTAGGQAYTFDANGNLLNDGVNTYTYDSANRLTAVNGQSSVSSFAYNGLGDRLSQTVDGAVINYTLDLNAGLTQVLSDGTNAYTYGLGRISQTNSSTAEYFLGDALGSVRQMTDQSGAVTFAQSYDPYGVIAATNGTSHTDYGFTGESQATSGDSTQLLYLRARYYNIADGRFQSRDTWGGDSNSPTTMNRWAYANSNPVVYVDPMGDKPRPPDNSGVGHFVECFQIHSISQLLGDWILGSMTAQDAVNICKKGYNPSNWSGMPFGSKLTSAHNLFGRFLNGDSKAHLVFTAQDRLTRELASSNALQALRIEYTRFGDTTKFKESKFNTPQQMACFTDYTNTSISDVNLLSIPLSCLMGSFNYQMKTIKGSDGNTYVGFRIDNRTDLGSGTHIAGRFEDELYKGLPIGGSVEDLISNGQISGQESIAKVMDTPYNYKYVVSILSPRTSGHGANLQQTYVWMEKYDPCDKFSFTVNAYASSHKVMEWANWYPPITQPIPNWDPNH